MSVRTKPKRVAGQVVYVGMRVYDPVTKKMKNCTGMTVRLEKFTPAEVHELIVQAALKGYPTARLVGERTQTDGKSKGSRAGTDGTSSEHRIDPESGPDRPLLRP